MTFHDEDDDDYPLATEGSKSDVSSTTDGSPTEEERDEVQEVREMSSGDTRRIQVWRFVVTGCLLITGAAITLTTHKFLVDEQESNFETAVSGMIVLYKSNESFFVFVVKLGYICFSLSTPRFLLTFSQFEQFSRTIGDAAVSLSRFCQHQTNAFSPSTTRHRT
jgi:hypothetical protein